MISSEKIPYFCSIDMFDSLIILKKRKPRKCQCCGGRVLPILYGYPSHQGVRTAL